MSKQKLSVWKPLYDGLLTNNPTFIQLLGMCPTLAITTSVTNAVGMGLAATAVLVCSNILISLLRKFIPKEIRIAAFIVIISGFVTAVQLLMQAYVRGLYETLGVYIPLIVVNCIILARAEAFASKNKVLPSALDGIGMGLGFTGAITVVSAVREILGNGTILGLKIPVISQSPALIFVSSAGAFFTLGTLLAVIQGMRRRFATQDEKKAKAQKTAQQLTEGGGTQ